MLSQLISGDLDLTNALLYILSTLVVVFLTLPIHEFAHGFAAVKLGDSTPKWQGRLTLNPFAHIDYIGSLAILLFGFGWAKPVGVNPRNFRNPKIGMAVVALAGPLSNIIMSLIALILTNVFAILTLKTAEFFFYLAYIFQYIAEINASLAVFNLIPVPPLDGSRILFAVLPDKYYFQIMRYERYIYIILMMALFAGALDIPLYYLRGGLLNGLSLIADLPFNLLGIF